jgi:hypothetical protein
MWTRFLTGMRHMWTVLVELGTDQPDTASKWRVLLNRRWSQLGNRHKWCGRPELRWYQLNMGYMWLGPTRVELCRPSREDMSQWRSLTWLTPVRSRDKL